MSNTRVNDARVAAERMHDISLWKEVSISGLNAGEKKRYKKYKAAIQDYFTTDMSIDRIVQENYVSKEKLEKLAKNCLMQHEDGDVWGFRALLPRVMVVAHTSNIAAKAMPTNPFQLTLDLESSPIVVRGEVVVSDAKELKEGEPTLVAQREAPAVNIAAEETRLPQAADVSHEPDMSEEVPAVDRVAKETQPAVDVDTQVMPIPQAEVAQEVPAVDRAAKETQPAVDVDTQVMPIPQAEVAQEVPAVDGAAKEAQPAVDVDTQVVPIPQAEVAQEVPTVDRAVKETQPAVDVDTQVMPIPQAEVASVNDVTSPSLPTYGGKLFSVGLKKTLRQQISARKHWLLDVRKKRKQKQFQRIFSRVLLVAIVLTVLVPVGTALAAYGAYSHIRGLATDGINHLMDVKSVLSTAKSDPAAALNADKLHQVQSDFSKAESDFTELQQLVGRSDIRDALEQYAPQYGNKLTAVQKLVQVGLDVSRMGSELSSVALLGVGLIHSSPFANGSTKPLLSGSEVAAVEAAIVHALYYIDDIQLQMNQVQLKDLPVSDQQKAQLTSVLTILPKAREAVVQAQGLVGIASWLLGVGQTRRFLVQTMDRGELRPGGGFTGQYGVLELQDGRMSPFSLRDVALLDYAGNGTEIGRLAPPQYRWMNFGNWGLRDSNLSGDFPTTAKLSMQVFQEEGGIAVDGDIAFTPTFIGHILDVTGPITVQDYNEVITSKNLEDRLHYYQQNFTAIAVEQQKTHNYGHEARKSFTSLVGKLLLERVRKLPVSQLTLIAKNAIKDIQSRDLEIYFNNPAAEAWLVEHGYSAATDTFSKQDGFMVVQANISISKASQYVHTTEQDNVTLDAQGGATHSLTITLDYKQTGPVYGFDTYADYIRVYAPASAIFLSGNGFDTGKALCTPSAPASGQHIPGPVTGCGGLNSGGPGSPRYCPNGDYSLGTRGYTLDSKGVWAVDSLGAPTARASDLPGRAMWGGLTETPKNCISTITLSWYVPHVVKNDLSHAPYSLLVQKQGGYVPTVEVVVDTSAMQGLKPFNYSGNLVADQVFSLAVPTKKS